MTSTKNELTKLSTEDEQKKTVVKRLKTCLNESIKAIEVRQKHIKIADRSELGWAVVTAYEDDELASDSGDEKQIYKAEREAERLSKRKWLHRGLHSRVNQSPMGQHRHQISAPQRPLTNQGFVTRPACPRIVGPC